MPACDSVNAMKTPTVYSGMRFVTLASYTRMRSEDTMARATIPVLKASRSPRCANWRGMNRSVAMIDASRGNPLKAVFAARMRMTAVVA